MKNTAVLLAAGKGARFGGSLPKQFELLLGKPVFIHSALAFERHSGIDSLYIVADAEYFPLVEKAARKYRLTKLRGIIQGGKTRTESSVAALSALAPADKATMSDENIIFHDAARPLLTERIISACIEKLATFEAVTAAISSIDTVFIKEDDGTVAGCPDRETLMLVQTPQGFRRNVIEKAYALALAKEEDGEMAGKRRFGTDDCAVVKSFMPDVKIAFCEGAASNIKLTYRDDLYLAKALMRIARKRVSEGGTP